MSDIRSEILFPGSGPDTDSDLRFMAKGDGRERRNILIGGDESNGIIINMFGNKRTVDYAEHQLILSRCYRVIGSYYNRLQRAIYYFIFSLPYEITTEAGSTSSSTSTTTTTTTTTPGGDSELDIDYTSGEFQYDNMLLRYWEDEQTIDVIFIDTKNYFGLHYDYPMRDMSMIGNWLFFNPRVSEPKMIDVEMAYNYTNYDAYDGTLTYVYGDYVTYYGGLFRANQDITWGETPVTDTDKWDRIGNSYQNETGLSYDSEFRYAFNVIKQPPIVRPTMAYESDTTINSNNVRGRMFRFAYRYKYFDDSYSVYSAYSDVSRPPDDETWDGAILDDVTSNNYIAVTVQMHSAALVDSIEIVFQVIGEDWRRCKIVNRQEQAELTTDNFTYNFYNNEAYEIIVDNTLVTKVYDSVPKIASSQEIINKNILCYGGCTEGFDNIPKEDVDVTLTPVAVAIEEVYDENNVLRDNIINADYREEEGEVDDSDPYARRVYYSVLDASAYVAWGVVNGTVFRLIVEGQEGSVTLNAGDVVSANALIFVIALANTSSYVWSDISHGTSGELWLGMYDTPPVVTVSIFYESTGFATALSKHRGFKTGAFHPFCLFYYDSPVRRWDAQTSKENINTIGYTYAGTTVYVPMLNEMSPPLDTANRWTIDWTIDHLPPTNAKFWRWGYAGNSLCSYFVQYIIEAIGDGVAAEDAMTYVDITPLQTIKDTVEVTWNQFPQSNISPYEWEKGDRIRFITEEGDPATPGTDLGATIGTVLDFEIIKQDTTTNYIYVQEFNYAAHNIGECSLVEIYKPIKETSREEFYEFGSLMPILTDSAGVRVHGGIGEATSQDTTTGTPASGTFNNGDVYHIMRTPNKLLDNADTDQGVFHESQWYSDFYDSDDWDRGKIGVETNFKEKYLNIIRYSNQYLQNTEINGLSTFESDSYKELNDVFGNIVAIYELGDTLKCYQERKASSILIGRTEYSHAEGDVTVAISTSVLGAIRYSPTNYSTVFPECISRNNRYIYGFDIYNGVMWRDAANGIFPISGRYADANGEFDYRMAHYFKDKSKALLVSGIDHCDVMSVWDEEFKNLYLVFKDYVDEANNETIVFHEPSNRWICFMDLEQTPASHNEFLECTYEITKGFEGGIGYSFDEDTRFAVFNILAPGNKAIQLSTITMTMLPYTPSIEADGEADGDAQSLTMTVYTPTVHISNITATTEYMYWLGDQYGSSVYQSTTIANTDTTEITSIPSWIIVTDDLGSVLNVGFDVSNETIRIYPSSANNTGVQRSGYLVLTDSYGNVMNISLVQDPTIEGVDASIEIDEDSALFLFVSNDSVEANDSSTQLDLTFTPDHLSYSSGQSVDLTYTILKNGAFAGSGGFTVTDEVENNKTIYMTSAAFNGDTVVVYLEGTL